ncbi:uncharacterized protein si:ch211-13f8.1 isoform X2 [Osmerus eperlanus]|uniref:uncharacterized protein si:ch211-13f8.1 isoform X2 n=1 Tax=Osmerus eperlanus TaxID=29151 RepID=UPI002E11B34D
MEDLEVEIQRDASPSGSPPQERASEPGPPSTPSPPSPPAGSAVHALQTKVRAVSYRPGRRERRRDKRTSDIQPVGPGWSLVMPREKARGKGRVNPPVPLKYPECGGALSSSEEEEEDGELEVQVEVEVARLHLKTSPPGTPGEPEARSSRRGGGKNGSDGGPVRTASGQPVPPRGLGEGSSVENLQTDVLSSTTDGPSPSKPAPPSSSLSFLMTSSSSTTTSSSSSRHWAPPKGFWRVVRPETLHLNGAEPLCAAASLPVKDYTLLSSLPVKDYSLTTSLLVKDYGLTTSLPVKDHALMSSIPVKDYSRTSLPVKDYTLTSSLPVKDHTLMSSIPVKDYSRTSLPVKDYTLTSSLPVKDYPQDYTSLLPVKDYIPTASLPVKELDEHQRTMLEEADWGGAMATPWELQRSDSLENYLDRCERRGAEPGLEGYLDRCERRGAEPGLPLGGLWRADSCESVCSQGGALSIDERVEANQRARGRRGRPEREEGLCVDNPYRYGDEVSRREDRGGCLDSDSNRLVPVSYPRSLFQSEELPLSPRHEQAKLLLERARLKARSNHVKGERPPRRSQSDQRYSHLRQHQHPPPHSPAPPQNPAELKTTEEVPAPAPPQPGPLLVPQETDSSTGDRRLRHQGYSPTRVRFEDESEREAESRYLDRVRERGRSHKLKAGKKEKRVDPVIAVAPPRQDEAGPASVEAAWGQEVTLRKCEACGSILRDPPPMAGKPQVAPTPSLPNDDQSEKPTSRWAPPPSRSEPSVQGTKVKVPVVTFAGAFILGEDGSGGGRGGGGGWGRRSGFGKLRRRSRKGESRLESGNGPYGPSWAQRRNSLPRPRGHAPTESPAPTEHPPVGNSKESPTPPLPIKSALKSSSRPRPSASPSVQFRLSQAGEPGGPVGLGALETGVEGGVAPSQTAGPPALVPCIRPSSLRYSSARITPDLPPAELWDTPSDGGVVLAGDSSPPIPEFRPRGLGVSRTDDLRAELLRSEHLKAEGQWEEGPEGARRGPGKLSLRRFFSSLGLNSVGRLVKGGRSSSMEQLSVPPPCASSPSPTRRPHSPTRLQRTPSLQALNTVSPLAQLRKASSVQSLERRAERSTILGELHVPCGLAPRELQRALSVEEVLAPGGTLRPVGGTLHPVVSQPLQDGTLLLEISRPPNGPFGFLISRGKGRPDTGVYIEQVGGGPGEGQYVGLLGVGDEILEVNGEAVGGLTLDQVTRLMTRDSTASLRILPCRHSPR